jgi:hypothetical protein
VRGLPEVAARPARLRRWGWPAAVAVALVVTAVLAGPPPRYAPGDPGSTAEGGLRGILDVASSLDRQVDIAMELPDDTVSTYLLVVDDLDPGERDAVRDWVAAGGRLVVADPASPLGAVEVAGSALTDLVGATAVAPGCPSLEGLGPVRSSAWIALVATADAVPGESCFPLGEEGAWLVRRPSGSGEVLALGGPGPLANEHLAAADNALAGVTLLAPRTGDRLLVRPLPAPGSGDEGIAALVPRRVRHLVVALVLSFGVLVWWRGRRLGAPVPERLPLRVPAAAVVDGVAGLLHRSGDREAVARSLRDDLRETLRSELGLTVGIDDPALATLAGERLGVDPASLTRTLTAAVPDDAALLALSRRCHDIATRARSVARGRDGGRRPASRRGAAPPRGPGVGRPVGSAPDHPGGSE